MSYTVGLDFGTHQTKICIEDSSNPAQKLYEFVEFKDGNGAQTVLFPSIVQVNIDETVSYGFVNKAACKHCVNKKLEKPILKQIPEPILVIPEKPIKPHYPAKPQIKLNHGYSSWQEQLQELSEGAIQKNETALKSWEEKRAKMEEKYEKALNVWQLESGIVKSKHRKQLAIRQERNDQFKRNFELELLDWEKNKYDLHHYRYFKLACFSNSITWNHEISQDFITVWYLTYLIFLLQEKLGNDFYLQMGIPSGTNKQMLAIQTNKAYSLLMAAYKLVELYQTKELFLSEKYCDLLGFTEINKDFSDNDLMHYGLNVLPEAYAGLASITQQKRLETGMSLLVDIGGGTTDVAFFTIREEQPDIHSVISFSKGLNYIFEDFILQNRDYTIQEVQKIFFEKGGDRDTFDSYIAKYHESLSQEVNRMVDAIIQSFKSRFENKNLTIEKLRAALVDRQIIYCGGGAIYDSMRTAVMSFTDKKLINKSLLNIPSVQNGINDELFTILATSYGLSIPQETEIELTPIENVFDHIEAPFATEGNWRDEHGLKDD